MEQRMHSGRIFEAVLATLLLCLGICGGAWAAPGDLAGFNFLRDSGNSKEEPVDVAVGASGKIYVLNRVDTFDYRLQRFNADGTVDAGFGSAGAIAFKADDDVFSRLEGFLALVVDEANDRALVGGAATGAFGKNPRFVVRRLNFDGSFDRDFGDSGRARIDTPNDGVILRMALDASGSIVLAGVDGNLDIKNVSFDGAVPFVARLTADGEVDANFTQTMLSWGGDNDAPAGVYVESDGTILVSGAAGLNAAIEFGERTALSRLAPNGGLDGSFGIGGTFVEDFEPGACEDDNKIGCEGAALYRALAGGQFLMTVYLDRSVGTDEIQITRFNANGTPDASFGSGGFMRYPASSFIPGSVPALQGDGRAVLAKDEDVLGDKEDLRLYQIEGYSQIVGGSNQNPVAVADPFRVDEDSANVVLRVLKNDSDADGDRLRIRRVNRGFDPLTGLPPSASTITLDARRANLLYTPEPNFVGTDTFSYTVIDGNGGSATATVTVRVRNANDDAPIAANDAFTLPAGGRFYTLRVLKNDVDPDPHTTLTITRPIGRPANGRVKVVDGLLRYRPDNGFNGTDSFGYEISDGALSARGTATVTVGP